MGLIRRLAALAVAAVAAVAAGCSGGGADVPDGFVEARVEGVARFAHPADWKRVTPTRQEVKLQVDAPGGTAQGVPATTVQVLHDKLTREGVRIDALVALQLSTLRRGTQNFETPGSRDVEVEGATAAKLVEATFETVDGGVAVHGYYVFAIDDTDHTLSFGVSGTDVDRDVALRVIETLRME